MATCTQVHWLLDGCMYGSNTTAIRPSMINKQELKAEQKKLKIWVKFKTHFSLKLNISDYMHAGVLAIGCMYAWLRYSCFLSLDDLINRTSKCQP